MVMVHGAGLLVFFIKMVKLLVAKMFFCQTLDLIQLMHQIYYQVNHGLYMVKQAEPLLMKNGLLQLVEDSMRKKEVLMKTVLLSYYQQSQVRLNQ